MGLPRSFYFASLRPRALIRLKLIRAIISANIAISCCFTACCLCTRLEIRGLLSWNTIISRESTRFLSTILRLLRLYETARFPSIFYLFHVRSSLSQVVSLLYTQFHRDVSPRARDARETTTFARIRVGDATGSLIN